MLGKFMQAIAVIIIVIVLVTEANFPLWGNVLLIVAAIGFVGSAFVKR